MRSARWRRCSSSFFPWCATLEAELRRLFSAYVEAKQRQHVLDYDDLLLYWAQMMAEPAIAAEIGSRFDHVLVDEYQDTNRLQASILLALKPDGSGLTVVGDDAQSIYSFRAATVRNILDFPGHFSPPAAIATLERNYRSTQPILAAANAVIDQAEERLPKNLWSSRISAERPQLVSVRDESEQARYVAAKILEHRESGILLKSQAVLFRASHHSAALEIELARRNIPFVKFGGLKFLEAAHVKDVLSFLRWAENLRDRVAGFRVIQLLPGVGPATAGRLLDRVGEAGDALEAIETFAVPAAAGEHWASFVEAIRLVRGKAAGWPAELDIVCRWYAPHLDRRYDDAVMRQADLVQLAQIASTYPSRERFLTELTLDPPDASSAEAGVPLRDEDYLILSTIHSAKGQEWTSVFVLNAVDGCIPSDLADRQHGRDRGGAAPPLCRDDARARSPAPRGAAALLRARAEEQRRPSHVCRAHALHSGIHPRPVRALRLAGCRRDRRQRRHQARARRHRRAAAPHVELICRHRMGGACETPIGGDGGNTAATTIVCAYPLIGIHISTPPVPVCGSKASA